MRLLGVNPIATWGRRAYEEDVIQGKFFGHSSFILNTPDAIKHVLVDNYENYTRTPTGFRVLRPMLGQGVLIAEGRAWKYQRRTLAPAFTPRAVSMLIPHMVDVTDETIVKLVADSDRPVDLRGVMQHMTLGDRRPHHVLLRHGDARRDLARVRDGIWRAAGAAAVCSIWRCRCGFRRRWISRARASASAGRASSPC